MKENNKNDPLEAQKRLFGTIKNIGSKISSSNRDSLSKNGEDPAYKFIKNKRKPDPDWTSKLKDDEKEYLKNYPSPIFESQTAFYKRFSAHENFKRKQLEVNNEAEQKNNVKISDNSIQTKEEKVKFQKETFKNKKLLKKEDIKKEARVSVCPNCGATIKEEDLFCGECGYKLEGINFSQDIEEDVNFKKEDLKNIAEAKNLEPIEEKKTSDISKDNNITTKKQSHNNLPIETLEILKSFFDDQLISESEYNTLRKSALNLSNNLDSDSSNSKELIPSIKSISREKLTELKVLFDQELIDKEEYDLLRRNLLFTK